MTPHVWLDPWWGTEEMDDHFHNTFREQLEREVAPDHPMHGLPVKIIARGQGDDALFAILDGTGRVAQVHLTWSRQQQRPPWPGTQIFDSMERWVEESMLHDHHSWKTGPEPAP